MSIQGTTPLVTLPRPLATARGRYLAAPVYTWENESKKRKRSEIAITVDGEGVNIYSDRQTGESKRLTYVSTVNQGQRLLCFSEIERAGKNQPYPTRSQPLLNSGSSTHVLEDASSEVVLVDVLPEQSISGTEEAGTDVLLVHEDGQIRCLDGDLSTERWRVAGRSLGMEATEGQSEVASKVEYATTSDVAAARNGLLRGQPDALASLDALLHSNGQHAWRTQLLYLLSHDVALAGSSLQHRTLHVLAIYPELESSATVSCRPTIRSLCQLRLPDPRELFEKTAKISLDVDSGILQLMAVGVLSTYDLCGSRPQLLSLMAGAKKDLISFLMLPSGHTLTAAPTILSLYDASYQSIQATLCLPDLALKTSSRKRKIDDEAQSAEGTPIELITFLPTLRLAVGRARNELVGVHLEITNEGKSWASSSIGGSLLEAIGHGISPEDAGARVSLLPRDIPSALGKYVSATGSTDVRSWQRTVCDLDRYARLKEVEKFERLFALTAGVSDVEGWNTVGKVLNGTSKDHSTGSIDTSTEVVSPVRQQKKSIRRLESQKMQPGGHSFSLVPQFVGQDIVLLAIKTIFALTPEVENGFGSGEALLGHPQKTIKVVFYPPNVFHWLLRTGSMTIRNVNLALTGDFRDPDLQSQISAEALVRAFVDFDPSMDVLLSVFEAPVFLKVEEVVGVAKALLSDHKQPPTPRRNEVQPSHLGNGNGELNKIHSLAESQIDADEKALAAGEHAAGTSASIGSALAVVLTRLHTFPRPRIIKALRSSLAPKELIDMIGILRRELAAHGWTSSYLDDVQELGNTGRGSNLGNVGLLSNLLGCVLDSAGAAAWLYDSSSSGSATSPDRFVANLSADVSVALGVIEEATYLTGLIGGVLHLTKLPTKTIARNQLRAKEGEIVALPPAMDGANLLPLGSRGPADSALKRKRGLGGETRCRSKREIGRLKGMRVGKYSIEQIVI
ncbi:MAG: hypothetical protein M1826_000149 [Phylliscum demangeonii]|nr:MAG: hypothetical protein M1826_000149 [Phylliscum demangeonii]